MHHALDHRSSRRFAEPCGRLRRRYQTRSFVNHTVLNAYAKTYSQQKNYCGYTLQLYSAPHRHSRDPALPPRCAEAYHVPYHELLPDQLLGRRLDPRVCRHRQGWQHCRARVRHLRIVCSASCENVCSTDTSQPQLFRSPRLLHYRLPSRESRGQTRQVRAYAQSIWVSTSYRSIPV
jgi:hypothetical protein